MHAVGLDSITENIVTWTLLRMTPDLRAVSSEHCRVCLKIKAKRKIIISVLLVLLGMEGGISGSDQRILLVLCSVITPAGLGECYVVLGIEPE